MKINLVPEERAAEISEHKTNFAATAIAILIAVVAIVVSLILLGINSTKKRQVADFKKNISKIKNELGNEEYKSIEKKLVYVEAATKDIISLSESAYKWQRVFGEFERTIPEKMTLKNYSNNEGKISISGMCDSVETLNKFLQNIEKHKVETLDSAGIIKEGEKNQESKPVEKNLFKNIKSPGYKMKKNERTNMESLEFQLEFEVEGGILWK